MTVYERVKQGLFDNILEASKVDGKLYFIPVTLEVEGMIVKEDDVGKEKVGMTFEEYASYVENTLSGVQPYDYPESEYNYRDVFMMSCVDIKAATEGEKALKEILDTLTEREADVLKMRFGMYDGRTHTLEEVGQIFGVTRERIRQIENKAIRKLRHPSRAKKIRDFYC